MITADQAAELLRPDLRAKVLRMKRDGTDKMPAYTTIGDALGRSAVWVRRVASGDSRAAVRLHDALNFYAWTQGVSPGAAYAALCARIEGAAGTVENWNTKLRGEPYADDPGAAAPAPGDAGPARQHGRVVSTVAMAREGRP